MTKDVVKRRARRMLCPLLLVALICVSLTGCGARSSLTSSDAPGFRASGTGEEALSSAEMAALATEGPVDRRIPDSAMPEVERQYRHFLRKGRPTMDAASKRAEKYLAQTRKVFRTRGMPEDLAYLAIVESGYRPDALSRAGALGAWQFMPSTGSLYGLRQDWWMDERLDPWRAAEAAADYLQKLHGDFNDWPTALAAYNAGEGRMGRAMQATGTSDFYGVAPRNGELDEKLRLKEETIQYVPRFIAVTKIMRNLEQLGFAPIHPDQAVPVLRLTAAPGTDLMALGRECGMSWSDFRAMNRHHRRTVTSTERSTFVYVPEHAEQRATAWLSRPESASFAGWTPRKVQSGTETWEKIGRRAGVSVAALRKANPDVNPKLGETILVPGGAVMTADSGRRQPQKAAAPAARASGGRIHVLAPKETLYGVARRYDVSVEDLLAANGLDRNQTLRIGQELRIPGGSAAAAGSGARNPSGRIGGTKAKAAPRTYTVRAGDSLWNIARRHDVSVDDLKRWNKVDERTLRVGSDMIVEAR